MGVAGSELARSPIAAEADFDGETVVISDLDLGASEQGRERGDVRLAA